MVGAISAFASNFFYGQGPYTPWQMFAYGTGGMLAGFLFAKGRLAKTPCTMAMFGFFSVLLLVGPLLDLSSVFLTLTAINAKSVLTVMFASVFVNIIQAVSTAAVLLILGRPLLEKLDRVKQKYGLLGEESGI